MVSQLADIEYYHLCKELNTRLVNSRINKVYQVGENVFKITFNSSAEVGEGKISFIVDLPNYLTITNKFISTPEKPSAFVMNLRKYIDNARVISIEQPTLERILIFNLYAQGSEMKLVFEMFSNGNILLINSENKIVFTYRKEIWKDREIKKNLDYILPPSKKSCLEVSEDDLELKGKKNIMSGILSNISLSPKYLEYIILSENENPKGDILSEESIPNIITKMKSLNEIDSFYVFEDNKGKELSILNMKKENVKEFNLITEAIDYSFEPAVQKTTKKEKSVDVEKYISQKLEEHKNELDSTIKKAEFIYENYNKVEYVLKYVNSLVDKGMSEKEINEILEKNNMSVDLKEKKVKIKIKL